GAIQSQKRQRDDDCRRAMAALGGSAVDESLHEFAQALRVAWSVLHLVLNQIVGRLRELLALFVAAARDVGVVDGLARSEQLDHLVEAFRLGVLPIDALSR